MRQRLKAILGPAALVLASLLVEGPTAAAEDWTSAFGRNEPMVGQIWSAQSRSQIAEVDLIRRLRLSDFVLLGEKHDNADHHRLQAWLVRALMQRGHGRPVAFEMLSADQAPALATYLRQRPKDAAGLGAAVDWAHSGWPDWSLYEPIAQAALSAGAPVLAANLSHAELNALRTSESAKALGKQRASRLGLTEPLPAAVEQKFRAELARDHCGQLPQKALPVLVRIQRARDAVLAETLAAQGPERGGILIAGTGHVRNDRAVPHILHRLLPSASVASLAFVEVTDGATTPDWKSLPFDYLWYTPRSDNRDPCLGFKKKLRKSG